MDTPKIVETRHIKLPQGGVLDVELTQDGIDRLKQHFGVFGDQPLDDDHVRMYVYGALDNAVSKAEREMKDAKPQDDTKKPARSVRKPRRRKKDARG
jgi:hypothetical protein